MKKFDLKSGILFFYGFDIVLLLIFVLLMLPFGKKNQVKSLDTALLNPSYVKNVHYISLGDNVLLTKYGEKDMWIGKSFVNGKDFYWPCDEQTVSNMLENFSKVTKVYKKGDSFKSWKAFGVDNESGFKVSFLNEAKGTLSSFYFGNLDPVTQKAAFRTWNQMDVFETDDSIHVYCTDSVNFWCDPFIYPLCITEYNRIDSESVLRRGSVVLTEENMESPVNSIKKDFGNGASLILKIFRADNAEYDYLVKGEYNGGVAFSSEENEAVKGINYCFGISEWTYKSLIKEENKN